MSNLANLPVIRAYFNNEKIRRIEKKIHTVPLHTLNTVDATLIDVALNNVVADDSILPQVIEDNLMAATNHYYQVSERKESNEFLKSILVTHDSSSSSIRILIYDKLKDDFTLKSFMVVVPDTSLSFITNNMLKSDYMSTVVHLNRDVSIQYGHDLAPIYALLFHIVYQTDFTLPNDIDSIENDLVNLLYDTELTLHLNITSAIKLYGEIDDNKFLNLYIREIGTPDTYWSRSVLLPELIDQSLQQ